MYVNFWKKGGMRHYSESLISVLRKAMPSDTIRYVTNYSSSQDHLQIRWSLKGAVSDVFQLIGVLTSFRPDVIHVNSGHPVLLLLYPLLWRYRFLITIHDAVAHPGERLLKRIYHAINLFVAGVFCTKCIVHTSAIRDALPVLLRSKSVVISHVSYRYLVDYNREQFGRSVNRNKKVRVLCFGRMKLYKGIDILLQAWEQLGEYRSKMNLIIAGEGRLASDVPTDIQVYNKYISDRQMHILFEQCDVVVIPYIEASQSGVGHLALAYGKPVIASRVGGIPDVISHGKNGILVEPGNMISLRDGLIAWYTHRSHFTNRKVGLGLRNLDSDVASEHRDVYRWLARG